MKATDNGWGSAETLGLGVVSIALLVFFVARQATAATPLLPLRLFRSRNVSGANVILMLLVAGMFGMFFLGTLYLERVLGYDAIEIGLAFLPVSLGIGILSLGLSARLGMRFGPRNVLIAGLLGIGAGLVLMTQVPVDGDYVANLLPAMVLLGAGAGLSFPAIMTLSMSDATPEDSGLLSGLVNTMQQVGAAVGLAILATLSTTRTERLLGDGVAEPSALVDGYTLAFTVAAVLVAAAVVLSVVVLKSPARAVAPEAEAEAEPVAA